MAPRRRGAWTIERIVLPQMAGSRRRRSAVGHAGGVLGGPQADVYGTAGHAAVGVYRGSEPRAVLGSGDEAWIPAAVGSDRRRRWPVALFDHPRHGARLRLRV